MAPLYSTVNTSYIMLIFNRTVVPFDVYYVMSNVFSVTNFPVCNISDFVWNNHLIIAKLRNSSSIQCFYLDRIILDFSSLKFNN